MPLLRSLILLISAAAPPICAATEPLVDQVSVGERTGVIWPKKCCWVGLPSSDKLREVAIAERCSAIGGPVGVFRLDHGKLFLTALYRCGGPFPVQEIYPQYKSPQLADWVSGLYSAKLDWLCRDSASRPIYRTELELEIKDGIVTILKERTNDSSACNVKG